MSILDIFTSKPAEPAPANPQQQQQVPPNQGNIPAQPNIAVNADGTPVVAPVAKEPENPLDNFKDLWETAPVDPKAPKAPEEFKLPTAEQIQKSVAKADFTKDITPEQLAAVTAGGEGAAEVLAQLLNSVGRQSLAQATMVSNQLNKKATDAAIAAQIAKVPSLLRDRAATNHMHTVNPIFSNPAVKPVAEATKAQLLVKYPDATDQEITQMTQEYILAVAKNLVPEESNEESSTGETDWDAFLNSN